MELYKVHHRTQVIAGKRSLGHLQDEVETHIQQLEDESLLDLHINSVSIASSTGYDIGGSYQEWNALITYSYKKPK